MRHRNHKPAPARPRRHAAFRAHHHHLAVDGRAVESPYLRTENSATLGDTSRVKWAAATVIVSRWLPALNTIAGSSVSARSATTGTWYRLANGGMAPTSQSVNTFANSCSRASRASFAPRAAFNFGISTR